MRKDEGNNIPRSEEAITLCDFKILCVGNKKWGCVYFLGSPFPIKDIHIFNKKHSSS